MIVVSSSTKMLCVVCVPLMGEDRFEVIASKIGFADEDFGVGIVLVPSSAIVNGVGGRPIAGSTVSIGVEMKPLTGEFLLNGLPNVGLEIAGGFIDISIWNGELVPSFQVISSSSAAMGGESSKD